MQSIAHYFLDRDETNSCTWCPCERINEPEAAEQVVQLPQSGKGEIPAEHWSNKTKSSTAERTKDCKGGRRLQQFGIAVVWDLPATDQLFQTVKSVSLMTAQQQIHTNQIHEQALSNIINITRLNQT